MSDTDPYEPMPCRAAEYGDRALCGCDDCREYTAEQNSYEV